jgi:hypothetical protein
MGIGRWTRPRRQGVKRAGLQKQDGSPVFPPSPPPRGGRHGHLLLRKELRYMTNRTALTALINMLSEGMRKYALGQRCSRVSQFASDKGNMRVDLIGHRNRAGRFSF